MTEFAKMFASAGLIAAGFFSASLFGPPESRGPAGAVNFEPPAELQPIEAAPIQPADVSSISPSPAAPTILPSAHNESAMATNQVGRAVHEQPASGLANTRASSGSWWWPEANSTQSNLPAQPTTPTIRRGDSGLTPPALTQAPARSHIEQPTTVNRPVFPESNSSTFAGSNPAAPSGGNAPLRFPDAPPLASAAPATDAIDQAPATFSPQPDSGPWSDWSQASTSNAPAQPWSSVATGSLGASGDRGMSSTADEVTWHVVSDGDSLPKLAERYLRDATRSRELYELNRSVLTSPDLLPIGVELRIPPRREAPAEVNVFDSHGNRQTGVSARRRLVPLPATTPQATAPQARLGTPHMPSTRRSDPMWHRP